MGCPVPLERTTMSPWCLQASPLRSKRSLTSGDALATKLSMLAIPEDDAAPEGTIRAAKSPQRLHMGDGVGGLIEARRGSPGAGLPCSHCQCHASP